MNCPNCNKKNLTPTTTPTKILLHLCPNCRGTWSASGDLAQLAKNPLEFERQLNRAKGNAKQSDKPSPASGTLMLEVPFREKYPLYICKDTAGIWVEREEIQRVLG